MSIERAKEFVQYLANNPDARTELVSTAPGQRHALMERAGYGDVDAQAVADLLEAGGADLTDEQLKSIQGGLVFAAIVWD